MTREVKLIIAIIVALIGTNMIISRANIPTVVIGFVLVGVSGPLMYYYIARLLRPNPHQAEIDALATIGKQHLEDQEKKQNGKKD